MTEVQLNTQQAKAAYYDGPASNLLVMAGAGTGKTKVIVSRAEYLIKQGVDPKAIVLITFSNRAANEIRNRLVQTIGPTAKKVITGTFHSFCLQMIKRMPKSFGLKGSTILDQEDQVILLDLVRKDIEKGRNGKIPLRSSQLITFLSYSRNTCTDLESYMKDNSELLPEEIQKCVKILSAYKKAKKQRGYLDFDDLIDLVVKTLKAKPQLRKAICSRFREMGVDEVQDTNPIQFRFLKLFAQENVRLFCVGDPAQSIYRFRGAEFKHIYEFTENFTNSEVIPLTENYRSNQEILDVSNWLLGESELDYSNRLTAHKGHAGHKPQFLDFDNNFAEAWYVAKQIQERHNKSIPFKDVMVLVRTSNDARTVEAEFLKRGIPYIFIGGTAISKAAHVKDLVSLLRIVINKRDDLAWSRFLQLWPRVGQKTADLIVDSFKQTGEVNSSGMERHGVEAIGEYKRIRNLKDDTEVCIEQAIGLMCNLLKTRYSDWDKREKDFELIKKISKRYKSVKRFVDAFTLEPMSSTEADKDAVDDAVTIITVHSAKGAESPICFAINVSSGTYPHYRSQGNIDQIEEERRILYVCLTRAMNELFITRTANSSNQFYYEKTKDADAPYFFDVVPEELVEYDSSRGPKSKQLDMGGGFGLDGLSDNY